jgi:putative redox protein
MKVELRRVDNALHFEGIGVAGVPIQIDGSPADGGNNAGARPMELMLMGLGGCSAIDILIILKRGRQLVEDLRIEIEGDRVPNTTPSVFEKINIVYVFKGSTLKPEKVREAIRLSMEKYCSVTAILNKTAEIGWDFRIE